MQAGALTQYIDVAQVVLYLFWIFFAGLIYYLHQENKREGYPLESDRSAHITVQGYPPIPDRKTFKLRDGSTRTAPNDNTGAVPGLLARPIAPFPGAPIEPTGNPMLDGVGPGAYATRPDVPDMTFDGKPKIVPMRLATEFHFSDGDPKPLGMDVVGADNLIGGQVVEAWVDRSECVLRYLEVRIAAAAPATRTVLLPINFCRIVRDVKVRAVLAEHFASVPITKSPDSVTLQEEERIMAYYGGGLLYAEASRQEPFL